jgi:outer membrane protein TolC
MACARRTDPVITSSGAQRNRTIYRHAQAPRYPDLNLGGLLFISAIKLGALGTIRQSLAPTLSVSILNSTKL